MKVYGVNPVFSPNTGKYGPQKNSLFGHFSHSALFWAGKISWNIAISINNSSIAHGRRPRMETFGVFSQRHSLNSILNEKCYP